MNDKGLFKAQKNTFRILYISFFLLTLIGLFVLNWVKKGSIVLEEPYLFIEYGLITISFVAGCTFLITSIFKQSYTLKISTLSKKMQFSLSQFLPLFLFFGIFLFIDLFPILLLYSFIPLGISWVIGIVLLLLIPDFCIRENTSFIFVIKNNKVRVARYEKNTFFKIKILKKTSTYYVYDYFDLIDTNFIFDDKEKSIKIEDTKYKISIKTKEDYLKYKEEILYLKSLKNIAKK